MKMLKLCATMLIMTSLLLIGCNLEGPHWLYDLPNEYTIFSEGAKNSLGSLQKNSSLVNELIYYDQFEAPKVSDMRHVYWASNENYVGMVMTLQGDYSDFGRGVEVPLYWYLVDEQDEAVYGPYQSADEFDAALQEMSVPDLGHWRRSYNQRPFEDGVLAFCLNERYVGLEYQNSIRAYVMLEESTDWYFVDTETDMAYGPYSNEEEYEAALDEFGIDGLRGWISATHKPAGARS